MCTFFEHCWFLQMAKKVVSYFHRTYFGTSRLSVELAFSKGAKDTVGYRPWSKYSAGSSRHDSLHEKKSEHSSNSKRDGSGSHSDYDHDQDDDVDNMQTRKDKRMDKKKEEFLEVMMGSKKGSGKMWGNDDGRVDDSVDKNLSDGRISTSQKKPMDDDESCNDNSSSAPSSSSDDESDDEGEKVPSSSPPSQNAFESDGEEYSSDRLFIRNLPFHATEEEIKDAFSAYGDILECHIPIDDTNRSKGYAFVKYASSKNASQARTELDGSSFQGRLIHVLRARPERDNVANVHGIGGANDSTGSTTTHKQKLEMERKQNAQTTTIGSSTNFVRSDAVVDNIADRFGMEKGDVLNVKDSLSSGNAAVRLALGETQVLEENREYFRKHGIQMDALLNSKNSDESTKRSLTMILVKNLPYDTSHDELSKLFLGFGGDATVLLSPSKTIGLVKYKNVNDAKKAFRKLAYKRYKHVPLYLEYAPLSAESTSNQDDKTAEEIKSETNDGEGGKTHDDDNDDEYDVDEAEHRMATLYVKNLNFSTTENEVKKVFQDAVGKENILSVRIPTKVAPVKGNTKTTTPKVLSMGYGFVECRSDNVAKKAMKMLQGKIINSHAFELKVSSKSSSSNAATLKTSKKCTKLMVRNVPFQASRTEILQLFGSFGQLKTVRLPKKFDGGHRGFAFVEFTSVKEAQNAMKTLSQTHLYGRHLVLEWSHEDDNGVGSPQIGVKKKAESISIEGRQKAKRIKFN